MPQGNKYIIIREDLVQDPVTIITDGLLVGRLQECELLLNHPSVSRAQAGIKLIQDSYFLFGLRPSNPVKLNGKPVEENEALAPGDVLEVGPFELEVDLTDEALVLKVSLQIGTVVDTSNLSSPDLDIFWDKRIREAGKLVRLSPLFPRSQRRAGKAAFNWSPTSDLRPHWPVSFFIWGAVAVGLLSVAAAYWYASAYSPGPVARPHAQSQLTVFPPIAIKANGNSCTSCHSFSGTMEQNCAQCHNTEVFVATVIQPHAAAGIGCISCHAEHRGTEFHASQGALATCSECHNNANLTVYNGHKVSTPHGGTFGYPVVNGKWTWKGLNESDWTLKQIAVVRLPEDTDDKWSSKQFHALHVQRVRANGLPGNASGELSCSSCHKTFNPIDRETPRSTCGTCHNGRLELGTNRVLIAADKPNCTSCHVQHVKDKRHWNASLMPER